MKNIVISMLFVISSTVLSAENCKTVKSQDSVQERLELSTEVPKWLEGATITVRLSNGQESSVSAEKFKVVPRKQQFIVTKTLSEVQSVCSAERLKNRVSLHGGMGPSGNLKVQSDGNKVTVETGPTAVGGLSYQRNITDEVSVGGQVQTNQSVLFSLGLDF